MTITDRTNVTDIAQADEVLRRTAIKALAEREVVRPEEMLTLNTPTAILGWCRWWDGQSNVGKELLAERIRSGQSPPATKRSLISEQAAYGNRIVEFLRVNVPQVCRMDPKIIKWERKVYGETAAARMAAYSEPHYAAIAAIRRAGKGLPVKELRRLALAAVRAADEEAVRDYKAIFAKTETNAVQEA